MFQPTRERFINSAEHLLQRGGFNGLSIKALVAHAGAPIGSFYHHFPDGKAQLVREALDRHAERAGALLEEEFSRDVPLENRVRRFFSRAAEGFEKRGADRSCAVGSVILDATPSSSGLAETCRNAFEAWGARIEPLMPWDEPTRRASFARAVVISLEGAFVVARATGDGQAFREAGEWLARSVSCPDR